MKLSNPGNFIFGDWKSPVLWALEASSGEGGVADRTLLPKGQIVILIPVSTALTWRQSERQFFVSPGSVAMVETRGQRIEVERSREIDGIVVGMRHASFSAMLEPFRPGLAQSVRELVYGSAETAEMPSRNEIVSQVVPALRNPAVSGAARAFWFESQFKALVALLCFVPAQGEGEFFCSRQKRLARVRVARAKSKLEARLDEVFDLNRLALEVGCSASYLSRTFSVTTGITISQYVRKRRIEKAAELLVTGRYNVSEVAIEVGYQSLSHFSKAFQQEKGCLPSRYCEAA